MLLNAKKELRQKGITKEEIVVALKDIAPRFHNPYTEEPLLWSPEEEKLSYDSPYPDRAHTAIGLEL